MTVPAPDSGAPSTTIALPIRNAESEIAATLEHLVTLEHRGPIEVVVVVNGSVDDSAHVARQMRPVVESRGWSLQVLELDRPGKPNALRVAEAGARPGVFVTCDLRVRPHRSALRAMLDAIHRDGLSLVSGELRYLTGKSALVNAFTRAYSRAPFARGLDIQGGFQAFAPEHRHVIAKLPDISADDRYFTLATPRADRRREPNAQVDYSFPDRFLALLRQQVRWRRLNRTVDAQLPHADRLGHEEERKPYFGAVRPRLADITVYWFVTVTASTWARLVPARKVGW